MSGWTDIATITPANTYTWYYNDPAYYKGKLYILDYNVLRTYTIKNNTWSTISLPTSNTGNGFNACVERNGLLYCIGLNFFYYYDLENETWSSALNRQKTGGVNSLFFSTSSNQHRRIHRLRFFNDNYIMGLTHGYGNGNVYKLSNDLWYDGGSMSGPSNNYQYISDYYTGQGLYSGYYVQNSSYTRQHNQPYYMSGHGTANLYNSYKGNTKWAGYGPKHIYLMDSNSSIRMFTNGQFSTGNSIDVYTGTDPFTYDGPRIFAEGYWWAWQHDGAVAKKFTPFYEVSGNAQFEDVEIIVYDQETNWEIARTYSRADASWSVGLPTNDKVNIVANHPNGTMSVTTHIGVTPIATD